MEVVMGNTRKRKRKQSGKENEIFPMRPPLLLLCHKSNLIFCTLSAMIITTLPMPPVQRKGHCKEKVGTQ